MIQLNELRIGNLLKWKSSGGTGISKVSFIENRHQDKTIYSSPNFQLESASQRVESSPIPLDKEWLDKLEFKFDDINKAWYKKGLVLCLKEDNDLMGSYNLGYFIDSSYLHKVSVHLKYVHEIQNVYYALTLKEIEINGF
jgi:hypothetical protein